MSYVVSNVFNRRGPVYGARGSSRAVPGWGHLRAAGGPGRVAVGDLFSNVVGTVAGAAGGACAQVPILQQAVSFAQSGVTTASSAGGDVKAAQDVLNGAVAALADAQAKCGQAPPPPPPAAPTGPETCDNLPAVVGPDGTTLSADDMRAWCRSFQTAGLTLPTSVQGAHQVGNAFVSGASAGDIQAWANSWVTTNKPTASFTGPVSRIGISTKPTLSTTKPALRFTGTTTTKQSLVQPLSPPAPGGGGAASGGMPGWVPWVGVGAAALGVIYFMNK